jgi:hypothetical protein
MTVQENNSMFNHVKEKSLFAFLIVIATFLAVISMIALPNEHSIKAQIMTGDHESFKNKTAYPHEYQYKMIINGTIDLEQTIFEAIDSKVSTSLIQAMIIAEKSVGNNSSALAAFGSEDNGYFTYRIILGTPNMQFYNVIVDPGNGHILAMQKVSQKELEKMHKEHSAEVVRNSESSIGFPLLIPH